jgi:hypothetical protein
VAAAIERSASSTITGPKHFDLLLPLAFTCRAFLHSPAGYDFGTPSSASTLLSELRIMLV